jgi:hypothetical protein
MSIFSSLEEICKKVNNSNLITDALVSCVKYGMIYDFIGKPLFTLYVTEDPFDSDVYIRLTEHDKDNDTQFIYKLLYENQQKLNLDLIESIYLCKNELPLVALKTGKLNDGRCISINLFHFKRLLNSKIHKPNNNTTIFRYISQEIMKYLSALMFGVFLHQIIRTFLQ